MSSKRLPRFLIYQPNKNEFHICLEVGGKFLRWAGKYPPTLNVNFPREVKRIADLAVKNRPKKGIFDEGTYAITQSKKQDKGAIEEQVAKGIDGKSFSFVLNGDVLKGRFAFKRNGNSTVIQKFKDKFAKEEDVLSGDLIRTINTMLPDYDESKVKPGYPKKPKRREIQEPEVATVEEVTVDKTIGDTDYHFAFYTSEDEPDLCIVSSEDGTVLVLKKEGKQWVVLSPVNKGILKKEREFTEHAAALYDVSKRKT